MPTGILMASPLPAKFVQEQVWLAATRPTIPTVTTEMPMPNQDQAHVLVQIEVTVALTITVVALKQPVVLLDIVRNITAHCTDVGTLEIEFVTISVFGVRFQSLLLKMVAGYQAMLRLGV